MTGSGNIIFGYDSNSGVWFLIPEWQARMLAPAETAVRLSLFIVRYLLLPECKRASCHCGNFRRFANIAGLGKSNY